MRSRFPDREAGRRAAEEFVRRAGNAGISIPDEHGDGEQRQLQLPRHPPGGVGTDPSDDGAAPLPHGRRPRAYFLRFADENRQRRWIPGIASGDLPSATSEPGTGSDVAGISATATRRGDTYVLNGPATFIAAGIVVDFVE